MRMRCNERRCDAMRCNEAMRCDAMRCDAMRCDAMRPSEHGQGGSHTGAVAANSDSERGEGQSE